MAYLLHDAPVTPLLVSPERDGEAVDLEAFDAVTAQLLMPDGTTVAASAGLVDEDGEAAVSVVLPPLDQAGVLQLVLSLSAGARVERFLSPLVVEEADGWHTLESAVAERPGFAALSEVRLFTLLATAKRDCVTYLPAAGTRRPLVGEREAQLLQARNRNAAAQVDPGSGDNGVDGYSVAAFPLDWAVKALLRPKRRFGGIR